jgi:hypothetical protein
MIRRICSCFSDYYSISDVYQDNILFGREVKDFSDLLHK